MSSTKATDGASGEHSRLPGGGGGAGGRAVELKGGMYTFMSLRLHTDDLDAIDAALADKVNQAPAFFKDTPVVLDLGELDAESATLDGVALLACIRRHHLEPIAATLGDKTSRLAETIALPLMESSARRRESGTGETRKGGTGEAGKEGKEGTNIGTGRVPGTDPGAAPVPGRARGTGGSTGSDLVLPADLTPDLAREIEYVVRAPILIDRPVRSGQQVYARDTDLIVMGQVGPGAEVIADNNIHVYGPLRGRALCGVSGNTKTRIFCQSLEAELVSVAGTFRMLETIPEELRGKPAQIWLDDERLNIEPL